MTKQEWRKRVLAMIEAWIFPNIIPSNMKKDILEISCGDDISCVLSKYSHYLSDHRVDVEALVHELIVERLLTVAYV